MAGIELQGKTPEQVYNSLIDKKLSASDAAVLVSGWIYHNFGQVERTFDYSQPFPAEDPACVAQFKRSFQHADWVDGESVVQAGQTPGEEGFNDRFHRVESDLDALSRDMAKAFACLADQRKSLRALLDEVRAELNRLNSDVFQCCTRALAQVSPATKVPPFGKLTEFGNFLGFTKFADKDVSLWSTEKGVMVLPAMATMGVDITSNPRMTRSASFGRFVEENNKRITDAFANQTITKKAFIEKFGKEQTPDGQNVRDLVDILPDAASFRNPQEMVDSVSDQEAAALRTTGGVAPAVALAFGFDVAPKDLPNATLDRFSAIPAQARAALMSKGIDNVSKLAAANPQEIAKTLEQAGVRGISPGDAAGWTTMAKTLTKLR